MLRHHNIHPLIHPHLHIAVGLLLSVLSVAATACSQSADPIPVTLPDPSPIVMGTGGALSFSAQRFARDASAPAPSASGAEPVMPPTCGVFGAMDDATSYEVFDGSQTFYYSEDPGFADVQASLSAQWPQGFSWPADNKWPYAPLKYWSMGKQYNFYCFAPHTSHGGAQVEMANNRYGGMQSLVYSHIPPYSDVTYCVSKDVVERSSGTVPFEMKHLSARLCLNMKIGEEYARMRDIKVKKVAVNDRGSDGYYYRWEIDLKANPHTYTLVADGMYTPPTDGGTISIMPIFDDPDGLQLADDAYRQFGSLYVMPQTVGTLRMHVTYDVYDKEGQKVRADQTISNDVSLLMAVDAGVYYDINILISPAYLYVLSDNDVKPDAVLSPAVP